MGDGKFVDHDELGADTIMNNLMKLVPVAAVLGLGLAACGGGSGDTVRLTPQPAGPVGAASATRYTQIERLSRPAVKEVFENFVDHQKSNAAEPYNDPTLQTEISGVMDFLRPPKNGADFGKFLAGSGSTGGLLYPDEYTVDLSQTTAAYLGVETGGASGGKFGGRGINDDVIGLSLGAVFGNVLTKTVPVQPEDNQENNCLSTQNLTIAASQSNTGSFPYLSSPH